MPSRPRLVLVAGPPGAGKSTLAAELGRRLAWPIVSRDQIKAGFLHAHQMGTPAWRDPVGRSTFALFHRIVGVHLAEGCSLIAEAALVRGASEVEVAQLVAVSDARVINCVVGIGVAAARFTARAEDPVRRVAHPDDELVAVMQAGDFDWGRYEPLDVDAPSLSVDCTDGYAPGIDEIVAFATGRGPR